MTEDAEEQADALLKKVVDAYASMMSKGEAYTRVVTTVGYAAFFTIWGFTRSLLSPNQTRWSALLMLVSLGSFIAFAVYNGFHMSRSGLKLSTATRTKDDPETLMRRITEYETDVRDRTIAMGRLWYYSWTVSVVAAVPAIAILAYAFVVDLLREAH